MTLATIMKTKKAMPFNLERFIATRGLIQANSGGGKSYCIRKILEDTNGKVHQIVIDLEGEFASLREEYDYILAGAGENVDVRIDIKSAKILARKVMELKADIIIDLSELKRHERIIFVKRFIDSMMNAPKSLWHPILFILDESHHFCPESKSGKAESSSAVIDVCTRGRKRGIAALLATQRISKLNKDAAAECNNKIIGRAALDIDMKRAAAELGFSNREDMLSLRFLEAGEFYCFGPAFTSIVTKVKINPVKTSHPDINENIQFTHTPPTKRVKAVLSKLGDVQTEAEEELREVADYQGKIRSLKTEIAVLKRGRGQIVDPSEIRQLKSELIKSQRQLKSLSILADKNYNKGFIDAEKQMKMIVKKNERVSKDLIIRMQKIAGLTSVVPIENNHANIELKKQDITPTPNIPYISIDRPAVSLNGNISGGAMRMLEAAATFFPNPITKMRMAAISGMSYKSGTFGTYLAMLKREGYIQGIGNEYTCTNEGMAAAGDVKPLPTDPESLIQMWMGIVKGGAARMLKAITEVYPASLTKEDIGIQAGISHTSGTFGTYLATLKRNSLIEVQGQDINASRELFET